MNEKTALLPTAPSNHLLENHASEEQNHQSINMPFKLAIMPGLEFDMRRKSKYGIYSLASAMMLLVSFLLVELRSCKGGPGIDLDRLQALHVSLMVLTLFVYLLSLFGMADYTYKHKKCFLFGTFLIYVIVGLMIWLSLEAIVNPCVRSVEFIPVDFFSLKRNVFNRGDGIGIIVFLIDAIATVLMLSAATSFYKRN